MKKEFPDVLNFKPKPYHRILTSLYEFWHSPKFYGWENINPKKPALLVSNHTIFGFIDSPLLVKGFYEHTNIQLRTLGDRFHFMLPHGRFLFKYGAVLGSRENCSRLMQDGQWIYVFPGGGREVCKRKGEQYRLTWKKRTGFVRMAVQHSYPIIPVAAVGAEECYSIHWDANDILNSPIGKLLKKTGVVEKYLRNGDIIFPICTGLGPTLIPRPERLYFSFGKPITTKKFAQQENDEKLLWEIRKKVEHAIYKQINQLQKIRKQDQSRHFF